VRTVKTLLSPLSPDEVKTVRGMGAQYGDGVQKPRVPVLFYKPASAICGPEHPIFIPYGARGQKNDYEVELCIVMGRTAKDISVDDALEYVLAYCTVNDVRTSDPESRRST